MKKYYLYLLNSFYFNKCKIFTSKVYWDIVKILVTLKTSLKLYSLPKKKLLSSTKALTFILENYSPVRWCSELSSTIVVHCSTIDLHHLSRPRLFGPQQQKDIINFMNNNRILYSPAAQSSVSETTNRYN